MHAPLAAPYSIRAHSFRTSDVGLANAYINNHVAHHQLSVVRGSSRMAFDCRRWSIGEIQVCDFSYGDLEVAIRLQRDYESGVFLVVPLAGSVVVRRGASKFTLQPGGAMVFNTPDENEIQFHDSAGFRNISLRVSRASLSTFLADEFGQPLAENIVFEVAPTATNGGLQHLVSYLQWLYAQFDDASNSLCGAGRHLAQHAHDLLLSQLIAALRNNYQEVYRAPNPQSIHPGYIRRAEEFMRSHIGQRLTINEIARAVGVAGRTLQLGFQRHKNYSAREFLLRERLTLARKALATAKQRGLSVTDVALDCGFVHLSRFSSVYSKRYGEKPSETYRKGC